VRTKNIWKGQPATPPGVQVAVNGYSDGRVHCQERKGVVQQDAEKVRRPVLFIWSVWSVWFVWVNETNQMNKTNPDEQDQPIAPVPPVLLSYPGGCFPLAPDVKAIEVLLWRNGFSAAC
jgi:hypothetical protein